MLTEYRRRIRIFHTIRQRINFTTKTNSKRTALGDTCFRFYLRKNCTGPVPDTLTA